MRARMQNLAIKLLITGLMALVSASVASAGELNPPAGPVAPTPGPEPRIAINAINTPGDANSTFRISQPGSYYLTSNITGEAAKSGIEIASNDVTIDLMGFTLRGVPGSIVGISNSGALSNITIRNGVVTAWGSAGISITFNTSEGARLIESIHASNNGAGGISAGNKAIVRHCTAVNNTGSGILAFVNVQIESCVADGNTLTGIGANANSIIVRCSAKSNMGDGFSAAASDVRIVDCVATANGDDGIACSGTAIISGCVSSLNTGDGIQVSSQAEVASNTCNGNGAGAGDGAGIHAITSANRVLRNSVTGNDRGIDIDSPGNLVLGNTAAGNTTEYAIAAGNGVGPIVITANVAANTNPGANFDL